MNGEFLIQITVSFSIALMFFYSSYDLAINNNFSIYKEDDKKQSFNLRKNKKILGEKLGLLHVIWGLCFFVMPIYTVKGDFISGIYYLILVILSITFIIIEVKILKKYL